MFNYINKLNLYFSLFSSYFSRIIFVIKENHVIVISRLILHFYINVITLTPLSFE